MDRKLKRVVIFIGALVSLIVACLGVETRTSSHIGWVVFFAGLASCVAGLLYLGITSFRQASAVGRFDRSIWLIVLGVFVIGLAPPLEYLYLEATLPRIDLLQDASLVLFVTGLPLFLWSAGMATWWYSTGHPSTAVPGTKRAGMYRTLIYPGYVGLGLMALALCTGYSSLIGLGAFLLLLLPGLIYRIWKETRSWNTHGPGVGI